MHPRYREVFLPVDQPVPGDVMTYADPGEVTLPPTAVDPPWER